MPRRGGGGNSERIRGVHDRHGVWCKENQHKYNNNRELRNMVGEVEEEVDYGSMDGIELLSLTENSVEKAIYYRGNSCNKEIFEMVPRLIYFELRGCFRLHIIWVDGSRRIVAGIDGFYRGFMMDGIDSLGSVLEFVPLKKTTTENLTTMLQWVKACIGVITIKALTPEGWFEEGHGIQGGKKWGWYLYNLPCKGIFLWATALSVPGIVLIQLGEDIYKRTYIFHVCDLP